MKKRISIILMAAILLSIAAVALGAGTISPPTPREDNPISDWAMDAVIKAGEANILEEGRNYIFASPITREEFCELIYNLIHTQEHVITLDFAAQGITDTENIKVLELYAREIVNGKTQTEFAPNDTLTREEAATIIGRTVEKAIPVPMHEMYYMFADESEISAWAMDGVQAVCNMGVMKGTGEGIFSPKGVFTVEEAVTALVRIYDTAKANEHLASENSSSFADNMYAQMPKDQNYMFSPLSIKMALLMAANGAEGVTQTEILNAIGVFDLTLYNQAVKTLLDTYSKSELLKLSVANSIWINKDKTPQRFSSEYQNRVLDILGAASDIVDSGNAVKKINGWVHEKTNGKIPTIISEDNKDFWAMLVNAVYFKGRWQSEFSKGATKADTFTDRNGKENTTLFMNKTAWMQASNQDGVLVAQLPYLTREDVISEEGEYIETKKLEGVDVSMYLMMADAPFSPERVLNVAQFESTYVALSVPKFKVEYSASLRPLLQNIGINKAFTSAAEFENMFAGGNVWMDSAIHKTYINVDEEGTEAAAVTALAMAGSALPPEPTKLTFNKPFTFVIKDNANGEILFMGEYAFAK